jgi:hypothetical protein
MKNRHRVSQVVSKAYLLMGVRRKILKQGAADRGEYRQAAGALAEAGDRLDDAARCDLCRGRHCC